MNQQMMAVLGGALQALAFVAVVRVAAGRFRIHLHAVLLFVAAAVYVGFAARAGSTTGMAVEAVGVLAFGGLAFLGWRRGVPGLIALGWTVHPLWDVALHTVTAGAAYTPAGWVSACLGFDLLLALLIARGWAGESAPCLQRDPAVA